jgi:hypothetical protein
LDLLRQIRNIFAHTAHLVDFDNEDVAQKCMRLRTPRFPPEPPSSKALDDTDTPKQHYIIASLRIS